MSIPKIIVIVGPTSVGKTIIALELAKKFNGEVISADSRQIYKEMAIGTGKPPGVWQTREGDGVYVVDGISHYGLDVISPEVISSVSDFKKYAYEKIDSILARGKLPLVVGGTGLYIWSVVDNLAMTGSDPDSCLRDELENIELSDLLDRLQKNDPDGFAFVDKGNKRRVIRALEIADGDSGESIANRAKLPPRYKFLQIGLTIPREELVAKIDARIDQQILDGFAAEAQALLKKYDSSLPSMSSIGYSQWAAHARGELSYAETILAIKVATHRYAKKQVTWFKRDKRIEWLAPDKLLEILNKIQQFL